LQLRSVLKGQGYASTKKAAAKEMTIMTVLSKNGFQKYLQKLYIRWQRHVTDNGNYSVGKAVCKDVRLLISVQLINQFHERFEAICIF
jgi:hypothetical protein